MSIVINYATIKKNHYIYTRNTNKLNWERGGMKILLLKLIGVNKGRHVTLKYFSLLINVYRKHRLFIVIYIIMIPSIWCETHNCLYSDVMKTSAWRRRRRPLTTDFFYWSTSTTDFFYWSMSTRKRLCRRRRPSTVDVY